MMMVDRDEGSALIFNVGDECDDDVYIDIEEIWRSVEPSDHHGLSEDTGVENMPLVEDKQGMPTSTEVLSADNQLPGFGVPYLPDNYEASDFTRGYLNGLPESPWNYGVPDCQRPEASSQRQGNDFYYTHSHSQPQNASSSFQNSSKRIPPSRIQSDLHVKKLKEDTNVGPSFTQMDSASTIDGDKIYHDASNNESSSGDFTGADMSDMLSDNGDLYFLPEDPPNYYQNNSGYDPFKHDGLIMENSLPPMRFMNFLPCVKDESKEKDSESRRTPSFVPGESPARKIAVVASDSYRVLRASEQKGMVAPPSIKQETSSVKMENDTLRMSYYHPKVIPKVVQNGTCMQNNVDDDSDLCILEDKSTPARSNYNAMSAKCGIAPHFAPPRISGSQIAAAPSRFKPNDERVIFQVAVQDLSQPKSEASPPDGLLSVPLLKHQRIALSWMVNKETRSGCCSGGILADDQGLGKTVSTIALILKERSPSSRAPKTTEWLIKTETLNLDEDDDGAMEALCITNGDEPCPINGLPINGSKASPEAKGRPSGGTLIVCPTSVLRQWAEELHNKVTSSADLSVLVYYGSSRTKDPVELAQYDVVITTYAIVSMEVPKQPVVNENDDQMGSTFKDFSSNRKRKLNEMTDKKSSKKSKKGIDSELLESTAGPLAKVGWFRVVLDEAQSIKNHRTQVARACWGLRAKRRWCLSGTPIQNAIDDLYSYFRFLRHEPYAVYKTFVEQIKVPVHRNPKTGYKKLQAVLKTIMLRRTKGTRIDGEPIINLPPKTIELKKIDFSKEERDFYCSLEAESRAQFEEYAAAGTVKQNYVNILLMLLRLRQACDHPLLVKGLNSNLKLTSSIEMAKKLPREKQLGLLNCLEASLAICGICNDPPEDAVVTDCGHVFCNQCICEHMIGDDSQCPSKKCKKNLNRALVFSTTALRTALSEQPSTGSPAKPEPLAVAKSSEPLSLMSPQDSSKIKAALDLLLSLCKPQDCVTTDVANCSEMLRLCAPGEESGVCEVTRDLTDPVKGGKAIVFSQWTGMLDLLESCLKTSSIQYRRLDGTMPVSARDRAVKDFNTLPQVTVMIMSLKAASLGLNMVAACNVILLDLWWNPTTEDQAVDRAHRIGQVRPVSVFRLTVKETVEDRILALQQRKREMVASAFGEDESGSRQTRLTVEDLKYLFKV